MSLADFPDLVKIGQGEGLSPEETGALLAETRPEDWAEIFRVARELTEKNFHKRICFFAPLYFSNHCLNDCLYCGFRRSNRGVKRRSLTEAEFVKEARFLWKAGHRSLLLVAGEHPLYAGVGEIASYVRALQRAGLLFSLMVESAPLATDEYAVLLGLGVRQVLLFQETYNRTTYASVHRGLKSHYDWRLTAMERAQQAGIERVGLGILLGLHDYREDLAALIRHALHFKNKFGAFPSTVSFPRIRPAGGISFTGGGSATVHDEDYQKIIAVTRLALPATGIVLSTRETPLFRRELLQAGTGITHMSAGSATAPGGYTLGADNEQAGQFDLLDHRPMAAVVKEAKTLGYEPVFRI